MKRLAAFTGLTLACLVTRHAPATVAWEFQGELAGGEQTHTFSRNGDSGEGVEIQSIDTITAQYFPRTSVDPGRQTLKSGSLVNLQLEVLQDQGWQRAAVAAQAAADFTDGLLVQTDSTGSGYIEFEWGLEGLLRNQANGSVGPFSYGYGTVVDFFYVTDVPGGAARDSIHRDTLEFGQLPIRYFVAETIKPLPVFIRDEQGLAEEKSTSLGTFAYRLPVEFNATSVVDVKFRLVTGVWLTAEQLDAGALNVVGEADYQNTASLVALRVLDESLQPLATPFEVISENGLSYPVAAVPVPAAAWLLGAPLGLLAVRRRPAPPRRRAPRPSPSPERDVTARHPVPD